MHAGFEEEREFSRGEPIVDVWNDGSGGRGEAVEAQGVARRTKYHQGKSGWKFLGKSARAGWCGSSRMPSGCRVGSARCSRSGRRSRGRLWWGRRCGCGRVESGLDVLLRAEHREFSGGEQEGGRLIGEFVVTGQEMEAARRSARPTPERGAPPREVPRSVWIEALRVDEPGPVCGTRTEAFYDGIVADVGGFFFAFFSVTNAVIEVAVLPKHLVVKRVVFFPFAHGARHRGRRWKHQERMEVVGHQQKERAVPAEARVVKAHGVEQGGGENGRGERNGLVAIDAKAEVEGFAVGNPARRTVVQL